MKQIHKYLLPMEGRATIIMSAGPIIKVGYQRCNENWDKVNLCVWAERNLEVPLVKRKFHIIMTGQELPSDLNLDHLDTLISENGQFVAHIFEELSPAKRESNPFYKNVDTGVRPI